MTWLEFEVSGLTRDEVAVLDDTGLPHDRWMPRLRGYVLAEGPIEAAIRLRGVYPGGQNAVEFWVRRGTEIEEVFSLADLERALASSTGMPRLGTDA